MVLEAGEILWRSECMLGMRRLTRPMIVKQQLSRYFLANKQTDRGYEANCHLVWVEKV